ncbi:hypothetical protein LX36DRAFT_282351 [Colletotrichum falcatum]|nr:hypothetical protein LX36DRAFT_282351 [Colletotrichum falcatum]
METEAAQASQLQLDVSTFTAPKPGCPFASWPSSLCRDREAGGKACSENCINAMGILPPRSLEYLAENDATDVSGSAPKSARAAEDIIPPRVTGGRRLRRDRARVRTYVVLGHRQHSPDARIFMSKANIITRSIWFQTVARLASWAHPRV